MAYKGDGAAGTMRQAAGIDTSLLANYTYHFWYKNSAAPSSAANSNPLSIVYKSGSTYVNISFSWNHTSAGFKQSCHHLTADGSTYTVAKFATALVGARWYGIGATWDAATLRAYLDGIVDKETAGGQIDTTRTALLSLLAYYDGAASAYDTGNIAEFGLWRDDLDADEMASLGKGCCPLMVRPDKLILYLPMIRGGVAATNTLLAPINEAGGGLTVIANTSVTITDHPPIIYPSSNQQFIHKDTANYPAKSKSFSSTVNLTQSTPNPPNNISQTLTLTHVLKTNAFRRIAQELKMASRFTADSGNIASGRAREALKTNRP